MRPKNMGGRSDSEIGNNEAKNTIRLTRIRFYGLRKTQEQGRRSKPPGKQAGGKEPPLGATRIIAHRIIQWRQFGLEQAQRQDGSHKAAVPRQTCVRQPAGR
ncbi:MAG TPA: hypothetical protein VFY40_27170 [Blastocatellia bacterium]|nr:hypothetical protein [Blastocatellia bacterium]